MPSGLRSIAVSGFLLVLVTLLASPAGAIRAGHDAADPYREVRIAWSDVVAHRGGPAFAGLEIMHVERDQYVSVLARNAELAALTAHGIPHSIAIPDLEAHYAAQAAAFGPGFGPFHTYSETVEQLDLLHATYPAMTTARISLGTTWEGNTIWAMKISDNPGQEEPGEPEVLFDGVHHAREIMRGPGHAADFNFDHANAAGPNVTRRNGSVGGGTRGNRHVGFQLSPSSAKNFP